MPAATTAASLRSSKFWIIRRAHILDTHDTNAMPVLPPKIDTVRRPAQITFWYSVNRIAASLHVGPIAQGPALRFDAIATTATPVARRSVQCVPRQGDLFGDRVFELSQMWTENDSGSAARRQGACNHAVPELRPS